MKRDGLEALRDPTPARRDNLPLTFTCLVVRAADLEAVVAFTDSRPVVPITGPAGTGKAPESRFGLTRTPA